MTYDTSFSLDHIQHLSVFKTNPKLLYKLKLNTNEESFYEAHQLYKTLHFRTISVNNFKEAADLIYNGILFFYNKKSDNVYYCYDLSKVYVDTLKKIEKQEPSLIDKEQIKRIKLIHLALKNGNDERYEFACNILKWSGTLYKNLVTSKPIDKKYTDDQISVLYQKTFGSFEIHGELAQNFWMEKNYVQSRYHFLHSLDGNSCAKMIIECHMNHGYPSEVDLFLTQNVLQYLCLRNMKTAREFYEAYIKLHPQFTDQNLSKYPLINFIKFLFICIQHDQVIWYKTLLEIYKPSLDTDHSYGDYLERIGEYFFNIKTKKVEKDSIFNNLFKMLTGPVSETVPESNQASTSNLASRKSFEDELEDSDLLD